MIPKGLLKRQVTIRYHWFKSNDFPFTKQQIVTYRSSHRRFSIKKTVLKNPLGVCGFMVKVHPNTVFVNPQTPKGVCLLHPVTETTVNEISHFV